MAYYIETFYLRGRIPGESEPDAYHVELGAYDETLPTIEARMRSKYTVGVMSPAQASAPPFNVDVKGLVNAAIVQAAVEASKLLDALTDATSQRLAAEDASRMAAVEADALLAEAEARLREEAERREFAETEAQSIRDHLAKVEVSPPPVVSGAQALGLLG